MPGCEAQVAQLVEHMLVAAGPQKGVVAMNKHAVGGSIPSLRVVWVAQRQSAVSARYGGRWFKSIPTHFPVTSSGMCQMRICVPSCQ